MHGSTVEPASYLRKPLQPDGQGSSGCWIGGEPTLPTEIEWPFYNAHDGTSVPMHFLTQINLDQLPLNSAQTGLPEHGTLFFFYDTIVAPCFEMGTKDECKVIYVEADVSEMPTRPMPRFDIPEDYQMLSFWYAKNPTCGYQRHNVLMVENLDDEPEPARRSFFEWLWGNSPKSELKTANGAPYLLGEPWVETTGDIVGDRIPLFTMFSDKDIGFQHGDQEGVVFLISSDDIKVLNFDEVILLTDTR